MAAVSHNYDTVIETQQKRILELEADLTRYTEKIRVLKSRASESHQAAITAAATAAAAHANAHDFARAQAAHMHAMMALSHTVPGNGTLPVPILPPSPQLTAPPNTPDVFSVARGGVKGGGGSGAGCQTRGGGTAATSAEEDERAGKTRYWTEMEHNQFLYAVKLFGPKNYVAISNFVRTRSPKQVRTHAQKYQMRLEREAKKRRAQAAAMSNAQGVGVAAMCVERAAVEGGRKTDSEVGSVSTCPTVCEERKVEMDVLRESACSPVSDGEFLEDKELRKNASLGNLADYDDFMRRITSAVQDDRVEAEVMFENSSSDLEMDILEGSGKNEEFEDSLLADL